MPTALGPFDICSSAFQPKEFPCAENNGKQDVTFRWEKGGSGNGIPCHLLPLLIIILPCLPFVSGSFINFSAQPSRHPQSALTTPFPVLSLTSLHHALCTPERPAGSGPPKPCPVASTPLLRLFLLLGIFCLLLPPDSEFIHP